MTMLVKGLMLLLAYSSLSALPLKFALIPLLFNLILWFLGKSYKKLSLILFGGLFVLIPIIGAPALSGFLMLFAILAFDDEDLSRSKFILPFLFVLVAGALAPALAEFSLDGFFEVSRTAASISAVWTLFLFWGYFSVSLERRQLCFQGMAYGLLAACVTGILQLVLGADFTVNADSFWVDLNRISASFSDPNAFGVCCSLLVWIYWVVDWRKNKSSSVIKTAIPLLFILCLFSGSRTALFGVFFLTAALLFIHYRKLFWAFFFVSCVGFAAINLVDIESLSLPVGLRRAALSLSIPHLESSFASRLKFFRMTIEVWQDAPLLGVGFGNFYYLVPEYGQILGESIGLWMDNPNSLWLGLLAETGVLGVLVFLACFFFGRFTPNNTGSFRKLGIAAIVCFLVQLAFGPHIVFPEVSLLFALLLASCFEIKTSVKKAAGLSMSYILVLLVFIQLYYLQAGINSWGLYPFEKDKDGFFRWGRKNSQLTFNCLDSKTDNYSVKHIPLVPNAADLTVSIDPGSRSLLKGFEVLSFSENCRKSILAKIQASHDYNLQTAGLGGDMRNLSYQLRFERMPDSRFNGLGRYFFSGFNR